MERAIWAARLHQELSAELAHFTFGGTGIVTNLPDLSNWLEVGRLCCMLPVTHANTCMQKVSACSGSMLATKQIRLCMLDHGHCMI